MLAEITNHENRFFEGEIYIFNQAFKTEGNIIEVTSTEYDYLDGQRISYDILISKEIELCLLQSYSGETIEDEKALKEIEEEIENQIF